MSNMRKVKRECDEMNMTRNVYEAKISCKEFFHKIQGDVLISGNEAGNQLLILELVCSYLQRADIPTIILSSHMELLRKLQEKRNRQEISHMMITCQSERNYMPFYGMSVQQVLRFIHIVAKEIGYEAKIDQVMVYAAAVLNIVHEKYQVCLPALTKLLEKDDDYISEFAIQMGLSNIIVDNIRGNHEAGIILRRICEYLEEVFEEIYTPDVVTNYSFQSGAMKNIIGMAMYGCSSNQQIMNVYLKEEIYHTLKDVDKVRVILDEMSFENENDELLKYLFMAKRQGKIELIFIAKNVGDFLQKASELDFSNVVMFQQNTATATEEISKGLFGTFQYHYPVLTTGDTPHILFSIKKAEHWQIQKEERLRVRNQDFCARPTIIGKQSNYLAIKTTANSNVYLIKITDFLPMVMETSMISYSGNKHREVN